MRQPWQDTSPMVRVLLVVCAAIGALGLGLGLAPRTPPNVWPPYTLLVSGWVGLTIDTWRRDLQQ